jgi:hypothetical protein
VAGIRTDSYSATHGTGVQRSQPRLGAEKIVFRTIRFNATAFKERMDSAGDERGQLDDVVILRRKQLMELRRGVSIARIHTTEHEYVKMDIQIECVSKSLNECNCSPL